MALLFAFHGLHVGNKSKIERPHENFVKIKIRAHYKLLQRGNFMGLAT